MQRADGIPHEIVSFIGTLANKLLPYAPNVGDSAPKNTKMYTLRKGYEYRLCNALADAQGHDYLSLVEVDKPAAPESPPAQAPEKPKAQLYTMQQTLGRIAQFMQDFPNDAPRGFLAAAVAVASVPAILHLLKINTSLRAPTNFKPFRSPIRVAARGGEPAIVDLLLKHARETPHIMPMNFGPRRDAVPQVLHDAIDDAIYVQATASAILLLAFLEDHLAEGISAGWKHMRIAADHGCFEFLKYLLGRKSRRYWKSSKDLKWLMFEACKNGQTAITRYLMSEGLVSSTISFRKPMQIDNLTPLDVAVEHGFPELVDLLVEYGAKLEPCLFTRAFERDGLIAPMVHHLAKVGCELDEYTTMEIEDVCRRF